LPVKILLVPIVAAAALAGCSTLTPTEDPVYLKMTDLEARLIRIERVVDNQSLIQLAAEVDRLRAEAQALRGELGTLRFETENSDGRQRDLYVDVDRRLQSLETQSRVAFAPPPAAPAAAAPSFAPAEPSAPPPAARPVGSDQQNYQAAFDMIQARRYEEAGKAFMDFLTAFPGSPLADNAQYWLAETYYVQRQFPAALAEFQKVIAQYPQSAKLPDALLKVGYCQVELGDNAQARTSLQQVMRQFPDTTAARLASQRLDRL
jgi:tol-pal system protein YbgF